MKLKEIKDLLDTLSESQLEQNAFLMGVDEPGFPIRVEVMQEPYLQTDYGLSPPWPEMTEEEIAECPEVYPSGSVFFYKAEHVDVKRYFEVRQEALGFRVYDIDKNVPISHVCPEEIAKEICSDFNKMANQDYSPLFNAD